MSQNSYDIPERILKEVKSLAEEIKSVETVSGLVSHYQKAQSLCEKIVFLKMLQEEEIDLHQRKEELDAMLAVNPHHENTEEALAKEEEVEKKYDNAMKQDTVNQDIQNLEKTHKSVEENKNIGVNEETKDVSDEKTTAEKSAQSIVVEQISEKAEEKNKKENELRVKLATIKGIKAKGEEAMSSTEENYTPSHFPKEKIKLDLNDKFAFSKKLFGGNNEEMDKVLNQLRTSKTLTEAKEYLSEIYHEKQWKNVDEYAQRLWQLVEDQLK